jgi:hypothetical protein
MDTNYVRIPATEARAGDEIFLADAWHATKGVFHLSGGTTVKVTWPDGGSVCGPAHHFMFRRAVAAAR